MRRLLLVLALAGAVVAAAGAQDVEDSALLRRLSLTQDEMAALNRIREQVQLETREIRLDLEVLRAQLKRQLFERNVDMEEVQRMLRQASDLEYRLRLAEIKGQLEVRKLLGEERWLKLAQMTRERDQLRQQSRLQSRDQAPDRAGDGAGDGGGARAGARDGGPR